MRSPLWFHILLVVLHYVVHEIISHFLYNTLCSFFPLTTTCFLFLCPQYLQKCRQIRKPNPELPFHPQMTSLFILTPYRKFLFRCCECIQVFMFCLFYRVTLYVLLRPGSYPTDFSLPLLIPSISGPRSNTTCDMRLTQGPKPYVILGYPPCLLTFSLNVKSF